MRVDELLSRLDGVRQTGQGQFIAKCPAHDDRSPSLSIRETDQGMILVNDFAGCEVEAVLDALGLTFSDLYPEPLGHRFKPVRSQFNPRTALEGIYHEAMVVAVIAEELGLWDPLEAIGLTGEELQKRIEMRDRLTTAVSRLSTAMDAAGPLRRVA